MYTICFLHETSKAPAKVEREKKGNFKEKNNNNDLPRFFEKVNENIRQLMDLNEIHIKNNKIKMMKEKYR